MESVRSGVNEGWTYHHNGVLDVQHLRDACFNGHGCSACGMLREFFFPVRLAERLLARLAIFSAALARGPLVAFQQGLRSQRVRTVKKNVRNNNNIIIIRKR